MAANEELEYIIGLMNEVIEDRTVPRNIRAAVEEARTKVQGKDEDVLKITAAIYKLDDVSNDINMPSHTRTEIWNIISELERIKEKRK